MITVALFLAQANGWKLDYELTQETLDDGPKTHVVESHFVGSDTSADKYIIDFKVKGGKAVKVTFYRVGEIYQYIKEREGDDRVEENSKAVYEKMLKRMVDNTPPDAKDKVVPEQHKTIAGFACTLYHIEHQVPDLPTVSWSNSWYPNDLKVRSRIGWLERKTGLRTDGKDTVMDIRTTTGVNLGK